MSYKQKFAGIVLSLSLLIGAGGAFAAQTAEYDQISEEVEEIRDLELLEPLDIETRTREELRAELEEQYEEATPEEVEAWTRYLLAFGFIEPGTDPVDLQIDIDSEQIGGYYNFETKQMVVVVNEDSDELTALNEWVFSHEVVHALQDQHFDLLAFYEDQEQLTDDELMALESLTEGDATLTSTLYLIEHPGLIDDIEDELDSMDTSESEDAPLYFQDVPAFPYVEAPEFVFEIYDDGGWEAVNDMYTDPPATTEQILHPEKFLAGEEAMPVTVDDHLDLLGDDWQVFDDNSMGEFVIDVFLRNGGARNRDARDASEGWGGDAFVVIGNEEETALVWNLVWDTEDDADEFYTTLVETEAGRLDAEIEEVSGPNHIRLIGEDHVAEVQLNGDTVSYTLTQNIDTLDILTGSSVAD